MIKAISDLSGSVTSRVCGFAVGISMLSAPWTGLAETHVVDRIDGSPVSLFIERPEHQVALPVVLFIDGSGCQSANREGFREFSRLPDRYADSFAKVFVDKPGVNPDGETGECTQTFLDYYSLDQRVLDHLRAIQYLRRHASWWNREIYLVGWSDGASIGVSVASYTPEITRAVFLGMGGGISMSHQFEDYILCAPDRTETRESCVEELGEVFENIRENPSPRKTWMGDTNTYKAWATRIDMVEYHLLKDFSIPVLIVHGEKDRDSVPVQSARELVRKLTETGGVDFEYWEVPDAGHNIGIHAEGQSDAVRIAMFNWLFGKAPGVGGPPKFGRPSGK